MDRFGRDRGADTAWLAPHTMLVGAEVGHAFVKAGHSRRDSLQPDQSTSSAGAAKPAPSPQTASQPPMLQSSPVVAEPNAPPMKNRPMKSPLVRLRASGRGRLSARRPSVWAAGAPASSSTALAPSRGSVSGGDIDRHDPAQAASANAARMRR